MSISPVQRGVLGRIGGVAMACALAAAYVHTDLGHTLVAYMHTQYLEGLAVHALVALAALAAHRWYPHSAAAAAYRSPYSSVPTLHADDDNDTNDGACRGGTAGGGGTASASIEMAEAGPHPSGTGLTSAFSDRPNRASTHQRHGSHTPLADFGIDPALASPASPSAADRDGDEQTLRLGWNWAPMIALQVLLAWASFSLRSASLMGLHNPSVYIDYLSPLRLMGMLAVSWGAHLVLFAMNPQYSAHVVGVLFLDAVLRALAVVMLLYQLSKLNRQRSHALFSIPPRSIFTVIATTSFLLSIAYGVSALKCNDWSGGSVRLLFLRMGSWEFLIADVALNLLLPFFLLHDGGANITNLKAAEPWASGAESTFMYLTGVVVAYRCLTSAAVKTAMVVNPGDADLPSLGLAAGAALVSMGTLLVASQRPSKPVATLMRSLALIIGLVLVLLVGIAVNAALQLPEAYTRKVGADVASVNQDVQPPMDLAPAGRTTTVPASPAATGISSTDPALRNDGSNSPATSTNATLPPHHHHLVPPPFELLEAHSCAAYANLTAPLAALRTTAASLSYADISRVRHTCASWSPPCLGVAVHNGQVHLLEDPHTLVLDRSTLAAALLIQDVLRESPALQTAVDTRFVFAHGVPRDAVDAARAPLVWALARAELGEGHAYLPMYNSLAASHAGLAAHLDADVRNPAFLAKDPTAAAVIDDCAVDAAAVRHACGARIAVVARQCRRSHHKSTHRAAEHEDWAPTALLAVLRDLFECGTVVALESGLAVPGGHWTHLAVEGEHFLRVPAAANRPLTRILANLAAAALHDAAPNATQLDAAWTRARSVSARAHRLIMHAFHPRALQCYTQAAVETYAKALTPDLAAPGGDDGGEQDEGISLGQILLEAWDDWNAWREKHGLQ
ncbi:hypothetical protein H9P43_003222 [Blastocladiella emersonii ATCC 22665]|nr:hypothetical protein H9P43_003222 [Blastocladiella emersonii ATCC 22665]